VPVKQTQIFLVKHVALVSIEHLPEGWEHTGAPYERISLTWRATDQSPRTISGKPCQATSDSGVCYPRSRPTRQFPAPSLIPRTSSFYPELIQKLIECRSRPSPPASYIGVVLFRHSALSKLSDETAQQQGLVGKRIHFH